jgi:hypothetical protein
MLFYPLGYQGKRMSFKNKKNSHDPSESEQAQQLNKTHEFGYCIITRLERKRTDEVIIKLLKNWCN